MHGNACNRRDHGRYYIKVLYKTLRNKVFQNEGIGQTGLTTACAKCVDAEEECVVQKCATSCATGGTSSAACQSCVTTNCTPGYDACAGG